MARSITLGDTEFFGPVTVTHNEMQVSNYDDEAAGDGESLIPNDVNLNRFLHVRVSVIDGQGIHATYDQSVGAEGEGAIRLFRQANDGTGTANDQLVEVPSNSNVDATVQLTTFGK